MKKRLLDTVARYIRDIVFGVEDSLVSTLGTITGVAIGTNDGFVVLLTGLVLIVVEATSMAAGSYISSKSEKEIWTERASKFNKKANRTLDGAPEEEKNLFMQARRELLSIPSLSINPFVGGFVMGVSYFIAGIIPLFPYFLFSIKNAMAPSIILTIATLFIAGSFSTRLSKRAWWKGGLEMLVVSGLALLFGFIIGKYVSNYL
ncbi:MAG: hypothetical protein ACD_76C00005G0003 [uncultured bacterium]|nr:MAG: hypothetical protein ACD_76C00005G0003 [uncultured bacterium]HBD05745.1 hypothetical protein [Candidatus Uhrbacteria bacterium]